MVCLVSCCFLQCLNIQAMVSTARTVLQLGTSTRVAVLAVPSHMLHLCPPACPAAAAAVAASASACCCLQNLATMFTKVNSINQHSPNEPRLFPRAAVAVKAAGA
jgi:hypothetical protein